MHGLEKLVKKQIIRIDNHKWGGGVVNDFNDSSQDVHLHKVFKFNRKKGECSIRIPLNNNQDVCHRRYSYLHTERNTRCVG